MQDAAGIDAPDRSAAGTEADDVEAVQCQPMTADATPAHQRRLALDDQADVRAGTAHVERDQVVAVEQLRRIATAGDAAGRTRQHAAGRHARRLVDRRDATMRLDDQDRPAIVRLDQSLFQSAKIARQRRSDIGVHHRCRYAIELLDLRKHLGRQRHIRIRHRIGQRLRRFRVHGADRGRHADSTPPPPRRRHASVRRSRHSSESRSSGVSMRPSARMRSVTPNRSARGTSCSGGGMRRL